MLQIAVRGPDMQGSTLTQYRIKHVCDVVFPKTWVIRGLSLSLPIPISISISVHGANIGPTWVLSAPDRYHVEQDLHCLLFISHYSNGQEDFWKYHTISRITFCVTIFTFRYLFVCKRVIGTNVCSSLIKAIWDRHWIWPYDMLVLLPIRQKVYIM